MKETVFDTSTGDRRFLDTSLAKELFRPLVKNENSYTKIRIGNKSFGEDAAIVASKALRGVQKTLRDVELKDFYFERSNSEALKVMSVFSCAFKKCRLRSLSLELVVLAEQGLRIFGSLLKSQEMLEELKFSYTDISGESARTICDSLPSVKMIKCLHFSYNNSENMAAVTLSVLVEKCSALEDFEFSGSGIGYEGVEALVRSLSKGNMLKRLNLRNNVFGTIGAIALSRQVIPCHLDLTEVYFDYINLRDDGTIVIANSLKDAAPSLRVLMLRGNCISPTAAPALADCLAVKNLLTMFYVGGNMLADDGSVIICRAILEGHEQLKDLDLSENEMTDIGALAAAKAVAKKPNFSRLFISQNYTTREGDETVKDVLRIHNKDDSVLAELNRRELSGIRPRRWHVLTSGSDSDSDIESEEELRAQKVRHAGSDTEENRTKWKVGMDSDSDAEENLKKQKVGMDSDSDRMTTL